MQSEAPRREVEGVDSDVYSVVVAGVEEVVMPAKATATTGVVVEAEAKLAHDAAEASGQCDGSLVHCVGKEVVVDVPPGS